MEKEDKNMKDQALGKTRFQQEEDGAVSVDWVVLTAAIVGVAATAGSTIQDSIGTLSSSIQSGLSTKSVENGD